MEYKKTLQIITSLNQNFHQSIKSKTMNLIKTLLFAILITFSSQISAHTTDPSNDLKSVSQQIETLLKFSEVKIYDDIIVNIKFKLNENNKIILVSNDSNNYDISKLIKTKLSFKELSIDKTNNYRFYSIPVKFKSTVK